MELGSGLNFSYDRCCCSCCLLLQASKQNTLKPSYDYCAILANSCSEIWPLVGNLSCGNKGFSLCNASQLYESSGRVLTHENNGKFHRMQCHFVPCSNKALYFAMIHSDNQNDVDNDNDDDDDDDDGHGDSDAEKDGKQRSEVKFAIGIPLQKVRLNLISKANYIIETRNIFQIMSDSLFMLMMTMMMMTIRNNLNMSSLMEFGAFKWCKRSFFVAKQTKKLRIASSTNKNKYNKQIEINDNFYKSKKRKENNFLHYKHSFASIMIIFLSAHIGSQANQNSSSIKSVIQFSEAFEQDNFDFDSSKLQTENTFHPNIFNFGQSSSEWLLDGKQLEQVPSKLLCIKYQRDFKAHLNLLSLANNRIKRLEDGSFDCLGETLKILFLQENSISILDKLAFKGLTKLQVLRLSENLIAEIPPPHFFEPLKSLRHLDLSYNKIESIPANAFQLTTTTTTATLSQHSSPVLSNLISLNLKGNPIHSLAPEAFIGLAKLKTLTLSEISLNDSNLLPSEPFIGLVELRFLYVDRLVKSTPNFDLKQSYANPHSHVHKSPSDFCASSPKLSSLVLKSNQLEQANQFVQSHHCKNLLLLDLSYNRIGPRLTNIMNERPFQVLSNLIDLYLTHNSISIIDELDFVGLNRLQVLDLSFNKLLTIHSRAFFPLHANLVQLDISNNLQLNELPSLGLEKLQFFSSHGNPSLRHLPHFKKARKLMLTFAYHCCDYNKHQQYHSNSNENPFGSYNSMINLHDSAASIKTTTTTTTTQAPKVFAAASNNNGYIALNDLVIWSPEIQDDQTTTTTHKPFKSVIVKRDDIKSHAHSSHRLLMSLVERLASEIEQIRASKRKMRNDKIAHGDKFELTPSKLHPNIEWPSLEIVRNDDKGYANEWPSSNIIDVNEDTIAHLVAHRLLLKEKFATKRNDHVIFKRHYTDHSSSLENNLNSNISSRHNDDSMTMTMLLNNLSQNNIGDDDAADANSVDCQPAPSAFFPCRDLFDTWWLRAGIWCVFPLGLMGNFLVIIVLSSVKPSSSSSALTSIMWLAHSKRHIDVPRFLVINLAIADLLMALYLGLLAIVDLSTLGQFKLYAIKWQYSIGCQVAGFFAILSSELSVFILAIITLERNYAITNAVHLNRRLSLQRAMLIMFLGYTFAIAMALMPLQGINDYRKFSICLPLDMSPDRPSSQLYLVTLLSMNSLSFGLLLGCYLRMYCAIRGSQAWNTNDLRIAKRMSILVLTDFLCWSPIIFAAIAALLGHNLVNTQAIKIMTIFILPLNSIANPFLYAITTRKFKRDLDNLLYQIRYILSFGHYAKRPPNQAHLNNIIQNNYINNQHHNQHLLRKQQQQQQQQHIIITCHQNKRQRFHRLKLDLQPSSMQSAIDNQQHNQTIKSFTHDPHKQLEQHLISNTNDVNNLASINKQQQPQFATNTMNQVTVNQTTCCEIENHHSSQQLYLNNNIDIDLMDDEDDQLTCAEHDKNHQMISAWQQQALIYGAIDPEPELELDLNHLDHTELDDMNEIDEFSSEKLQRKQQPRIVFDSCQPIHQSQNYHQVNNLSNLSRSSQLNPPMINNEGHACKFSQSNSQNTIPNRSPVDLSSNDNNNNANNINCKTNSGFSLKSYVNQFVNCRRPLPSKSTLSVACKPTCNDYNLANSNSNQCLMDNSNTCIARQRPRSALGNIPTSEQDEIQLFGNRIMQQQQQQQQQQQLHQQHIATGSLGFGGSDDLVESWTEQHNNNEREQIIGRARAQTPSAMGSNGQKSFVCSKRKLRFKPLARAWSSLQFSLSNKQQQQQQQQTSNISNSKSTSNRQQQQPRNKQIDRFNLVRSTSPLNYNYNYYCNSMSRNEIEAAAAEPTLKLIEQSNDEHPKLAFEDLIDLELHLNEIFQVTESPYLLLINPNSRLGERRMSRSCDTISHHNSPVHSNSNQISPSMQHQQNQHQQHGLVTMQNDDDNDVDISEYNRDACSNRQKDRQKMYRKSMQQSELSTTTTTTTTTTSATNGSQLDEDDQRVLLATINQLANRNKQSKSKRRMNCELKLLGNPSRSTRCRSWSPALLGKLDNCIGQIRSRLPNIANTSNVTSASTTTTNTPNKQLMQSERRAVDEEDKNISQDEIEDDKNSN